MSSSNKTDILFGDGNRMAVQSCVVVVCSFFVVLALWSRDDFCIVEKSDVSCDHITPLSASTNTTGVVDVMVANSGGVGIVVVGKVWENKGLEPTYGFAWV